MWDNINDVSCHRVNTACALKSILSIHDTEERLRTYPLFGDMPQSDVWLTPALWREEKREFIALAHKNTLLQLEDLDFCFLTL